MTSLPTVVGIPPRNMSRPWKIAFKKPKRYSESFFQMSTSMIHN